MDEETTTQSNLAPVDFSDMEALEQKAKENEENLSLIHI